MKIEFDSNEVLSKYDLREIAIGVVKEEVKRYLRGENGKLSEEDNLQRVVSNHAYRLIFDEVEKIVPNYKESLVEKIQMVINKKDFSYHVWQRKDAWHPEESYGWKIALDEMKKSEEIIRNNVRKAISDFDYSSFVRERVSEEVNNIANSLYDLSELIRDKTEKISKA